MSRFESRANLLGYTYSLDFAGHRTGVTELSGRSVSYGYDSIYRLTSETIATDPNNVNGAAGYTSTTRWGTARRRLRPSPAIRAG